MKKEERYIAIDGASFETELECLTHESKVMAAELSGIRFFDANYDEIDVSKCPRLDFLIRISYCISVSNIEEAGKIWDTILNVEQFNANFLNDRNPFLDDNRELVETFIFYKDFKWRGLSEYLEDIFSELNKVGCSSIHLLNLYQNYQKIAEEKKNRSLENGEYGKIINIE